MSSRTFPRARVELTRLGAWIIGVATVPILIFGVISAVSTWDSTQGEIGGRIFIAVWLVLFVGIGLNNLRICFRRTSTTRLPPGMRLDLRTPLFRITPIED